MGSENKENYPCVYMQKKNERKSETEVVCYLSSL